MADEYNYFHRWQSLPTIGSDLKVIWEMSANTSVGDDHPNATTLAHDLTLALDIKTPKGRAR